MEKKKWIIDGDKLFTLIRDDVNIRGSSFAKVKKYMDDSSLADAVEVVHGRWILADDGDGDVCSVCGTDFCNIIYETGNWNYCPNCGAKMEVNNGCN